MMPLAWPEATYEDPSRQQHIHGCSFVTVVEATLTPAAIRSTLLHQPAAPGSASVVGGMLCRLGAYCTNTLSALLTTWL
jgi:hypothetical protein